MQTSDNMTTVKNLGCDAEEEETEEETETEEEERSSSSNSGELRSSSPREFHQELSREFFTTISGWAHNPLLEFVSAKDSSTISEGSRVINSVEGTITSWDTTRFLCLSSCFWIGPAIYAYYCGLYIHSSVLVVTIAASINYLRNATPSWRCDVDLAVAKVAFVLFCITGIVHIRYIPHIIAWYTALTGLLYCLHMSDTLLYEKKNPIWYRYHFAFHTFVFIGQMLVIHNMCPCWSIDESSITGQSCTDIH